LYQIKKESLEPRITVPLRREALPLHGLLLVPNTLCPKVFAMPAALAFGSYNIVLSLDVRAASLLSIKMYCKTENIHTFLFIEKKKN